METETRDHLLSLCQALMRLVAAEAAPTWRQRQDELNRARRIIGAVQTALMVPDATTEEPRGARWRDE